MNVSHKPNYIHWKATIAYQERNQKPMNMRECLEIWREEKRRKIEFRRRDLRRVLAKGEEIVMMNRDDGEEIVMILMVWCCCI